MGRNTFYKKLTDALLASAMTATALFIINYYLNIPTAEATTLAIGSLPDKPFVTSTQPNKPFPAEKQYYLSSGNRADSPVAIGYDGTYPEERC